MSDWFQSTTENVVSQRVVLVTLGLYSAYLTLDYDQITSEGYWRLLDGQQSLIDEQQDSEHRTAYSLWELVGTTIVEYNMKSLKAPGH